MVYIQIPFRRCWFCKRLAYAGRNTCVNPDCAPALVDCQNTTFHAAFDRTRVSKRCFENQNVQKHCMSEGVQSNCSVHNHCFQITAPQCDAIRNTHTQNRAQVIYGQPKPNKGFKRQWFF